MCSNTCAAHACWIRAVLLALELTLDRCLKRFSSSAVFRQAAHLPLCQSFRRSWPCEQQCFHELLRNGSLLPQGWRRRIATAPMQLFNSPYGQFIRHIWGGGAGRNLRQWLFDDELKVQGVWNRQQLIQIVNQALATATAMPC